MSFLKKVNAGRRFVMRRLVRDLAHMRLDTPGHVQVSELKRILICRPNHRLGNLLLITPLLAEIASVLPNAKVDLFVKGNIPTVIFRNYPNVSKILALPKKPFKQIVQYMHAWLRLKRTRYDIVINVIWNSGSGTIATRLSNARYVFHGPPDDEIRMKYQDCGHMAKYPVYLFRHNMLKLGISFREGAVPSLDLRLGDEEILRGKATLYDLVSNDRKTIALYTFATGEKCYDKEWWEAFYERLLQRYPHHNIVEILPIENVSQISFKATSFYSRELRLIGSVIACTSVFIGADSGMMHLASASGTAVVGLFKAPNMSTYTPYNRGSVGINTNETDIGECLRIVDEILSFKVPGGW